MRPLLKKGGENMDWKKAIGLGALLWVLMFVIVSAFIGFKIYEFVWMQIVTAIIGGIISFILAGRIKPSKVSLALGYGLTWVVVGLILDVIVTMRFSPAIFTAWSLWLGYALVLLAPLLQIKKSVTSSAPPQP